MKKIFTGVWVVFYLFTYLPFVNSQSLSDNQLAQIKARLLKQNLTSEDIVEMKISDQYYTKSLDMTHTYFQQYFLDIPVENAIVNIGFKREKLVQINHTFADHVDVDPQITNKIITSDKGLRNAMNIIGKEGVPVPSLKRSESNSRQVRTSFTYDKGDIARQDIQVQLIWVKSESGLRLCWQNEIDVKGKSNEWLVILVDALTGELVKEYNMVIECNFEVDRCSDKIQHHIHSDKNTKLAVGEKSVLTNTYNVFDLPLESPNHGARTLTSSPWNRTGAGNPASTLGWHDNGSTSFTITRGNNVYAYEDQDNNNIPGYSPDGGASLDFNHSLDFNLPPTNASNMDASITNLFHTCNLTHDILYQYGFDEVAGNFQTSNMGRGGSGNDHVLAEAIDGAGLNNANFATPSDGGSGRMQMFLWSGAARLNVNSPAGISGEYYAAPADFGPTMFNVTGDLVLADDGTANPTEACNTLINGTAINGNIAVIDRGTCEFGTKVLNAENAGAIAVIVCNNQPGDPGVMGPGDDGGSVSIPSIMISQADCDAIKLELPGVNATLKITEQLDGSFDNGIIIHEYGHGVSNRLTGGPSMASCLNNAEQMGEGWSDFLAYMLATDWSTASIADSKGIGTFAVGQPTTGTGIRTYPYSTDMSINPFTYFYVDTLSGGSVHYIGSVWATMLWEMTWNIIAMEGINPDMYSGTGGNNIALQLVMDGMKLQPCSPGFVDGRDAILLADELLYDGKYKCAIWNAFAKRGLGLSASQGSSSSYTDGIEAFDVPDGIDINQIISSSSVKEGEVFTVNVDAICNCSPESNIQLKETIGPNYILVGINEGQLSGNDVISNTVNLQPGEKVSISFEVRPNPCTGKDPNILLDDDVEGSPDMINPSSAGKQWSTVTSDYNSSTTSWKAPYFSATTDIVLEMINSVSISDISLFTFYHKYETGARDGGVVEYSVNNGSTWIDAGSYFIENGYPDIIGPGGTNPLSGRDGFSGSSTVFGQGSSFVKSVIDLSSFAGQSIKLRFRFGTSRFSSGDGWYVDDINLTSFDGIQIKTDLFQSSSLVQSSISTVLVEPITSNVLFVDPSASGIRTGETWSSAYHSFADALWSAGCHEITTISLAEGTYFPINQRDTSFVLPSNIIIQGGFSPGGSSRDPLTYLSVLSGDIGTTGNNADNSYHVVYADGNVVNTTLDGIVIEKGQSDGGGENNLGSAIYNLGQITLKDVITRSNTGDAAVSNQASGNIVMKGKNILEN